MKIIKLMADYHCFPIWGVSPPDSIGCWAPNEFPLSAGLVARLERWQSLYDATLNHADPMESGFASERDEEAWETEGLALWRELRRELAGEYEVYYFSFKHGGLLTSPDGI